MAPHLTVKEELERSAWWHLFRGHLVLPRIMWAGVGNGHGAFMSFMSGLCLLIWSPVATLMLSCLILILGVRGVWIWVGRRLMGPYVWWLKHAEAAAEELEQGKGDPMLATLIHLHGLALLGLLILPLIMPAPDMSSKD